MEKNEVKEIEEELIEFIEAVAGGIGRSERRHWCGMYIKGLLMDGERKSIQPMARRLEGGNEQALQQFVNQSPWNPEKVSLELCDYLVKKLKIKTSVLVLDDTSLPKKGRHSVGVAYQYCGAQGKIANCQSIVSWHAVSDQEHFPLLAR